MNKYEVQIIELQVSSYGNLSTVRCGIVLKLSSIFFVHSISISSSLSSLSFASVSWSPSSDSVSSSVCLVFSSSCNLSPYCSFDILAYGLLPSGILCIYNYLWPLGVTNTRYLTFPWGSSTSSGSNVAWEKRT